ncbi:MAG: hypothetical protein IIV85_03135, partial [Clostridia bacterium]|nr:hypothetical protein [Clostridia bacterium]
LMASNDLSKTDNRKIFVEQQEVIPESVVQAAMESMADAVARQAPPAEIIALMKSHVPTYVEPEKLNGGFTS